MIRDVDNSRGHGHMPFVQVAVMSQHSRVMRISLMWCSGLSASHFHPVAPKQLAWIAQQRMGRSCQMPSYNLHQRPHRPYSSYDPLHLLWHTLSPTPISSECGVYQQFLT